MDVVVEEVAAVAAVDDSDVGEEDPADEEATAPVHQVQAREDFVLPSAAMSSTMGRKVLPTK